MAKRATTKIETPSNSKLIISKSDFKSQIEERIQSGEELTKRSIQNSNDLELLQKDFRLWSDYNSELLKQSFDNPNNEYLKEYDDRGSWIGLYSDYRRDPSKAVQDSFEKVEKKLEELTMIHSKISLIKSEVPEGNTKESITEIDRNKVFIVHGHDEAAKFETARFVEKLGFEPIILHEQVNSGQTIIEKIENNTNVGFGIVLYTPCDIGAKKGYEDNLKTRARQNVVFEHGYLIGKIGRKNVVALVKDNVETPNDISGVVYVSMNGDWKLELAKELRATGYDVDMNKVI